MSCKIQLFHIMFMLCSCYVHVYYVYIYTVYNVYIIYTNNIKQPKKKVAIPAESWPRNWGQCPQHSVAAPLEGTERSSAAVGRIVTGAPWYHDHDHTTMYHGITSSSKSWSLQSVDKVWKPRCSSWYGVSMPLPLLLTFALSKVPRVVYLDCNSDKNCAKYPCLKSMEVENVHSWSLFNLRFLLLSLDFFLSHNDKMEIKLQGASDK